jgi:flagellar L-ring protein precursor FlgH
MQLSQGEEWVQLSGIIRLADIDSDNRIASLRIADAQITYAGKGSVQQASREGWLMRVFNLVTPF